MHLVRLLVLALAPQHSCQVVLAPHCGWMLFAQHRLPQPQCLSICSVSSAHCIVPSAQLLLPEPAKLPPLYQNINLIPQSVVLLLQYHGWRQKRSLEAGGILG
jgi:hypothetical protein